MTEIEQMLNMSYDECCNFLKQKYGSVKKNFFSNEHCRSKTSGISRGATDGLQIHHIDEDKALALSNAKSATQYPFEYQLADRLVYCNLLEHLVLHIKIVEYPHPDRLDPNVGIPGMVSIIIPQLNDIYSNMQYKRDYYIKLAEVVKDQKENYFKCLKYLYNLEVNDTHKTPYSKNNSNLIYKQPNMYFWNYERTRDKEPVVIELHKEIANYLNISEKEYQKCKQGLVLIKKKNWFLNLFDKLFRIFKS